MAAAQTTNPATKRGRASTATPSRRSGPTTSRSTAQGARSAAPANRSGPRGQAVSQGRAGPGGRVRAGRDCGETTVVVLCPR